jgi:hypothetical protein
MPTVVDRKQIMLYFLGINLLALVGLSLGLSLVFKTTPWGLGGWSGLGIVMLSIAGAMFANWRISGWLLEKLQTTTASKSSIDLPGYQNESTGQSYLAISELTRQAASMVAKIMADRSSEHRNSVVDIHEQLQNFFDLGVQTLVKYQGCDYAAIYLQDASQVDHELQYRRWAVSQTTDDDHTNGRKINLQTLRLPERISAQQIDSITAGRLLPISGLPPTTSETTSSAPKGYLHIIHPIFLSPQPENPAAPPVQSENDVLISIFHTLATIFGFGISITTNQSNFDFQTKQDLALPGQPIFANAQDITIERRLAELESLWNISQSMAAEMDLQALYRVIHEQVNSIIGPIQSFAIVLYDQEHDMLSIPYMIEDDQTLDASPFPVGEGLSSIVIKNKQSLLLTHNSLEQSQALGAKFIGSPAKSWLGVPLIASGETVGLLIAQDTEQEGRFGPQDQHLLELVASQVAAAVRSVRLFEYAGLQAERERISARVVSKVWSFSDVETILRTTLQELSEALGADEGEIELEVSE